MTKNTYPQAERGWLRSIPSEKTATVTVTESQVRALQDLRRFVISHERIKTFNALDKSILNGIWPSIHNLLDKLESNLS